MARDYNGSTDRTHITTSGIATAPIALFARMNCDTQTGDGVPFGFTNSGLADFTFLAITRGASTDKIDFRASNNSTNTTVTTAGTYTAGTWHSVMMIYVPSGPNEIWLDGVQATGSSVSLGNSIDTLGLAAFLNSGGWGAYYDGKLASFALWQGATFDAATVMSLHKGFSPRRVHPGFLSCYMPLVRGAIDRRGFLGTVAESGTPVASDHPRAYGF